MAGAIVCAQPGRTSNGTSAPPIAPNSTMPTIANALRLLRGAADRGHRHAQQHEADREHEDERDQREHVAPDVQIEQHDAGGEDDDELRQRHHDTRQRLADHDLERASPGSRAAGPRSPIRTRRRTRTSSATRRRTRSRRLPGHHLLGAVRVRVTGLRERGSERRLQERHRDDGEDHSTMTGNGSWRQPELVRRGSRRAGAARSRADSPRTAAGSAASASS